jgi:hypothetical protein
MKTKKYYILKRNNENMLNDYLSEFSVEKRLKFKINKKAEFILIEKTIIKDIIGGITEKYSNLWTIDYTEEKFWLKYTKGKQMYDYTGVVLPLIHNEGKVYTFNDYCQLIAK